jgi:hypothetical protein
MLFFFFLLALPVVADAAPDQISLFIPAFEGPGALGRNVATVLNLQIWQTFRRAPWPHNPEKLDFGRGLIIWDKVPLKSQSHEEAESMAKDLSIQAQMVFWGKAYPYGNGVVVQTNLTIPEYEDYREKKLEVWTVSLQGRNFKVDIPRRRFEMSSIVLRPETIERYSLPSALKIYRERVGGESIGEVGDAYIGIQFEPGIAKVRSDHTVGWVRLPELGKKPAEIVDFIGGVIRTFRGDWEGSISSMRSVVNNPSTRTPLKIDAYLYWGMAMDRLKRDGRPIIEKAYLLNPFAKVNVQYLIMSDISAIMRLPIVSGTEVTKSIIVNRLKEVISKNSYLFPKNDPWLQEVLQWVQEVSSK